MYIKSYVNPGFTGFSYNTGNTGSYRVLVLPCNCLYAGIDGVSYRFEIIMLIHIIQTKTNKQINKQTQ